MVAHQKSKGSLCSPANYTEADVVSDEGKIIPTNPHCISNTTISDVLNENPAS
jgi:hypothetical protein